MKPAPFVYHCPTTVDEAVARLAEVASDDGRVLAGGQSLVPTMAFRLARPAHLIDINGIAELARLEVSDGMLSIGALVRHAAFHRSIVDGPLGAVLAFVAPHIAHHPIRLRGTFCGSLAHADPASEWCLVAATLGARMTARSTRGERVIAAADFFAGIMTTTLAEDELLTNARIPLLAADTRVGFYEFSRRAGDYAIAMALATFCIVDGGAEAGPRRFAEAERLIAGEQPSDRAFRAAAAAVADCIDPLEDIQADAAYRRDLVRVVTRRALERAAA
jgi:aerobic carbon-monoxide dehydrogenase medium subunit